MRSCQVLIVEVLCIVEISPPKYFSTIATARHLNPEPQCCFIGCKDGCGIAYLCAPGRFRGGGQNYCNLLHLTTKYFSALLQRDPPLVAGLLRTIPRHYILPHQSPVVVEAWDEMTSVEHGGLVLKLSDSEQILIVDGCSSVVVIHVYLQNNIFCFLALPIARYI